MFKALVLKEWREKAPLALSGLGLMGLFLAAFLMLSDKRDLADVIAAGFVLIVFPFIGLLLGAGAFESEFRDGAWAFLFSRPVRKETVWLVKLAASLAFLAGLWGIFLILVWSVPQLGAFVRGFTLPAGFQIEASFLPLAALSSLFYFSIAFSFSMLSERQFSLLFAALFTGVVLQVLLGRAVSVVSLGLSQSPTSRSAWLPAHHAGLALTAAAFLAASLLAFRRADFSQPRKKAGLLARNAAGLVAAAWVLALGGPLLFRGGDRSYFSIVSATGDRVLFVTDKGIYRYDYGRGRLTRLAGSGGGYPLAPPTSSGRLVYLDMAENELWTVNEDGSGRKLLVGERIREEVLAGGRIQSGLVSPDGKSVVFVVERPLPAGQASGRRFSMWSVGTDGAGLRELPLDRALAEPPEAQTWLWMAAWAPGSPDILLNSSGLSGKSRAVRLWAYDPAAGTARVVFESAWLSHSQVSPRGDFAALVHRASPDASPSLALLDLKTLAWTDILEMPAAPTLRWSWDPAGDRLAVLLAESSGTVRLSIVSAAGGRVTSSRVVAKAAAEPPPLLSVGWVGDGGRPFWFDPRSRRLTVLGPDLADDGTFELPAAFRADAQPMVFGGTAIVAADNLGGTMWRLDPLTGAWKKIR